MWIYRSWLFFHHSTAARMSYSGQCHCRNNPRDPRACLYECGFIASFLIPSFNCHSVLAKRTTSFVRNSLSYMRLSPSFVTVDCHCTDWMLAMWSQNIFLPSGDYCCSTIGGAGASEQFFLLSMLFRSVRALCCLLHFHVSFGSISPSMEYLPPDQVTVGAYYYPWWKMPRTLASCSR